MGGRWVLVLVLAAVVGAGCTAAQLKAQKDDSWSHVSQALPDNSNPTPGGFGHPFRAAGFLLHPVGVALDYALVRPLYMLAGLAPEWFGLTADDAHRYHEHHWELVTPQNSPRRFE